MSLAISRHREKTHTKTKTNKSGAIGSPIESRIALAGSHMKGYQMAFYQAPDGREFVSKRAYRYAMKREAIEQAKDRREWNNTNPDDLIPFEPNVVATVGRRRDKVEGKASFHKSPRAGYDVLTSSNRWHGRALREVGSTVLREVDLVATAEEINAKRAAGPGMKPKRRRKK